MPGLGVRQGVVSGAGSRPAGHTPVRGPAGDGSRGRRPCQACRGDREYTDTSIFIPERSEDGEEVPPEWFGMNPDYDEDSAEVIGSSVEEEGEAEDGSETEAPEDGAYGQPQLDRASSNEPRATEPTAAGGDQAKTAQPAAAAPDTAVSSDPSNLSAAS